jgi:hypothetical protein
MFAHTSVDTVSGAGKRKWQDGPPAGQTGVMSEVGAPGITAPGSVIGPGREQKGPSL